MSTYDKRGPESSSTYDKSRITRVLLIDSILNYKGLFCDKSDKSSTAS